MDWTPVVFAVGAVALIAWALVGLWISTFRKEPPLPGATEPASITEAARARARRWIRATDNRHPATENDPGRGSATTEKP